MPAKQPAPLRAYRNPFDILKDADRQAQEKRANLERIGHLTDETARKIAEERQLQQRLAEANHREQVRALSWRLTPTGNQTPEEKGTVFLANRKDGVSLLGSISLIVTETMAKDYPSELPFWMVPDDQEFAAAIERNHREALQIVKDAIRTNALPVHRAEGIIRTCNQEADVIAWCDDSAAARPPQLWIARQDARCLFTALKIQPPPSLFANQDEWLAATESAQTEDERRSAMTQAVIELSPPAAPSRNTNVAAESRKRKSRNDFISDALTEALEAVQGATPKALWRWIIENIKRWPEIEFDEVNNALRVGQKITDFNAFEARIRRRRTDD